MYIFTQYCLVPLIKLISLKTQKHIKLLMYVHIYKLAVGCLHKTSVHGLCLDQFGYL